ncbi:TetR/AcrR family transcriptional regulator C-terminal domain-containing protein [Sphaerimonospora cavernae]|uniref:TetR/AcrR family transcriptional regulator C-terminal domain-containing protein n=1 Tax=Sphaerimonospora cavernae TaxID=1740611 RepID=A0ABV6U8B4_9ACTN
MGAESSLPGQVWSRERRTPRRPALTVERIVEVCVAISDAEGLEALSMRRVAADLGTGTTSLYRHVAGRDELIELMIDAVLGGDADPPLTGDWHADLATMARGQRAARLSHPWLCAVLASRPALGPNSLRKMEHALATAGELTSDITLAADIVALIGDYVAGAVSRELSEREAQRRTGLTEEQWRSSMAPYIHKVVTSGAYPQFARRVVEARDRSFDEQFECGLACLLRGIAARASG